jgi:hypothetical protein
MTQDRHRGSTVLSRPPMLISVRCNYANITEIGSVMRSAALVASTSGITRKRSKLSRRAHEADHGGRRIMATAASRRGQKQWLCSLSYSGLALPCRYGCRVHNASARLVGAITKVFLRRSSPKVLPFVWLPETVLNSKRRRMVSQRRLSPGIRLTPLQAKVGRDRDLLNALGRLEIVEFQSLHATASYAGCC